MINTKYITVKRVAIAQGLYYISAALWPAVARSSYWRLFGPEYPLWLVLTISFLIFWLGVAVLSCVFLKGGLQDIELLGLSVPIMLVITDTWFVGTGALNPLYLFDLVIQVLLIFCWITTLDWRAIIESWSA